MITGTKRDTGKDGYKIENITDEGVDWLDNMKIVTFK